MTQPPSVDVDELALYRRMALIREFEEAITDMYRRAEMPGLVHSSAGQEAVAVGTCSVLRPEDYITSTHRGHGHVLAKGADLDRTMFEIMGKVTGYCRGRGGSMHVADLSIGVLGANGIVAGGVGIATGAALASSLRETGRVAVCFLGDGTLNQGVLFEVMNMAALWRLPVVYVCENNQYGQYSHISAVSAGDVLDRPRAFGIATVPVDGMDVLAVREVVAAACDRARAGEGPTFVMASTYRYSGHHIAEIDVKYRTAEEMAEWVGRDPLLAFATRLADSGRADPEQLAAIRAEERERVAAARRAGAAEPEPDPGSVLDDVYAPVAS